MLNELKYLVLTIWLFIKLYFSRRDICLSINIAFNFGVSLGSKSTAYSILLLQRMWDVIGAMLFINLNWSLIFYYIK